MNRSDRRYRLNEPFRSPTGSGEFSQHITVGLGADHLRDVAMLWAGRDVDHIARSGLYGVVVEPIADPAGQNENGMAGFAPRGLGGVWQVGFAFLVAQGDARNRSRPPHLQAVAGSVEQRMLGGGEQVGAGCHRRQFARRQRGFVTRLASPSAARAAPLAGQCGAIELTATGNCRPRLRRIWPTRPSTEGFVMPRRPIRGHALNRSSGPE